MIEKSYDELNKYDFSIKYYLKFSINDNLDDCIEITEEEYMNLKDKINKKRNPNIDVEKNYIVGFYKNPECYVEQVVDKDVYDCLQKSQKYEKNKAKHERDRYLTMSNKQNDMDIIASKENVEKKVLDKMSYEELLDLAESVFYEKQFKRFYDHIILEIPITVIATNDDVSIPSAWESIDRAITTLKKILDENKKN